jgi:hypothetical protein
LIREYNALDGASNPEDADELLESIAVVQMALMHWTNQQKRREMSTEKQGMHAILEIMGHTRLAGFVTEEERFGSKLGRIDIPQKDGTLVTSFFTGSSIYRLTACSEEVAKAVALSTHEAPIHAYELPKMLAKPQVPRNDPFDDDDEDDNDDRILRDRDKSFRDDA